MFEAGGGGGGGLSAHQIYIALKEGPGTHSLESAYGVADTEATLEAERAKLVQRLAEKIEAGWEGQAGAAAFGAAKPLADVSIVGATNLEKTHILLQQQADGFNRASSQVHPVAENPPETNWIDDWSPWDTDTEDEVKRHQEKSEHNIRVYRQYDDQSMSNEQELPMDYSYLTDPGGSVAVTPPDGGGKEPVDPGKKDPWTPPGGDGRDDRYNPPSLPDENKPNPPDQTRPQQVGPPQVTLPNEHHNLPNRPEITRPPVSLPPQPPVSPPYPPGPFGPGGGGGTGGGPRGGGPGGGPRGGPGGLGATGPRSGFGGGSGAEHGPGGRAGAGALGGEHGPGGRGAAGGAGAGRGGAGMGGGMGGGGGRGQGGEDEEHTRASFLQEDDPEAIFGTDEVTAPPVIGE
ncbi:Glycine-rich cell wall structural protein 1 precursor [Alloactinosynnema sp. L-07]|uniref:hypothetical protein n=1 Tax=Alloactinosynnema sp. L-07 TaxID=1653480 RepID=UPI00065F0AC2|nr:hypothetical protein [Alloactinosynnema sp. L-07]CRK60570.1 Glycine-rich cell wall structural protein 1 precursor [Alloactinosynnema sp. L-07]